MNSKVTQQLSTAESSAGQPPVNSGKGSSGLLKKSLWALLGLLIVVPIAGVLIGTKASQFKTMGEAGAHFSMPPETVNAVEVQEQTWQPRVSAVGSVMAVQGTEISAEVEGVVRSIAFTAGAKVNKGDVLVQMDDDVEQAQLRSATVAADLAQLSLKRAQELSKTRNISQAELDAALTSVQQTQAQVDYIRALIAKKTIRAPFSGRLGIRHISPGQYLSKGTSLVSLQALDPVYVEFSLPQQRLGEISEGLQVAVTSDAYPGQEFTGKITAINPDIDPATRNIRIQATLANADERLRPGMFVSLDMILAHSEQVLFVPSTAVLHGPYGDSLFIIEEGKPGADGKKTLTVRQQFVHLGARQGDFVVATEGVKAGDKLVSTGVFKLRGGMPVIIDNKLAPKFSLEPTPNNS